MRNDLAVFLGNEKSPNRLQWEALDEHTREAREKEGMGAWVEWMRKNQG